VGQLDSALQHAPGRVAGELAALAAQGALGALEITGDPGGTIYLTEGSGDPVATGSLFVTRTARGCGGRRRVLAGLRRMD
jgi:hypothetical protein